MNTICTQYSLRLSAIVVGAGPSGLLAAAALAKHGLKVRVLGSSDPWEPTYGLWEDELDGSFTIAEQAQVVEHRWAQTSVATPAQPARRLNRGYVRLHTPSLHQVLRSRCDAAGVTFVEGHAAEVLPMGDRQSVADERGAHHDATIVVDATGRGGFLSRGAGAPGGFQSALGLCIDVDEHPWPVDCAVLMDWRAPSASTDPRTPTFLYVMPLSPTRVFVEETSLISRDGLPFAELRMRLDERLHGLGVHARAVVSEEQCRFSMGGPVPDLDQPILGFGAAAGMVHPATGYQLARALREADPFAAVVADTLRSTGDAAAAAKAGWAQLWSRDQRAQHAAFSLGATALLRLDQAALQGFFDAFFALPDADWRKFMGAELSRSSLASTLLRFFWRAPCSTRRALVASAAGRDGLSFLPRLAGA